MTRFICRRINSDIDLVSSVINRLTMLRNEGKSIVSRVQRVDRVVVGTTHTNRLHTLDRKQAVSYGHAGADSSILQCGFSACRSTTCGARFPGALRPVGSSGRLIASTSDSRFIRQAYAIHISRCEQSWPIVTSRFVVVDLWQQRKIARVSIEFCQSFYRGRSSTKELISHWIEVRGKLEKFGFFFTRTWKLGRLNINAMYNNNQI